MVVRAQQFLNNTHTSGGVEDMDDAMIVLRRNFDSRVLFARRRSSNQKRNVHVQTLHFLGDVDHFIETRSDQA